MPNVLFSLIVLSFSLVSSASVTSPACPTDPNEAAAHKKAVAYLKEIASSTNKDASCVDRLLRGLSTDHEAIPLLIEYLDFPAPPSMGSYHMHTPVLDKFPAVYALAIMENSSEPLLAALASGKLSGLKEHNAIVAYMLANEQDQMSGIKRILAYKATTDQQDAIALRMRRVARDAAQQCESAIRESCLQLTR